MKYIVQAREVHMQLLATLHEGGSQRVTTLMERGDY